MCLGDEAYGLRPCFHREAVGNGLFGLLSAALYVWDRLAAGLSFAQFGFEVVK